MELGNMVFGNSRGEWSIPRTDAYHDVWERFCERLGVSSRGYVEGAGATETGGYEDDTYVINPYDWDAECTCGMEDAMEAWHAEHKHSEACYQTAYRAEIEAWEIESGYRAADEAARGKGGDFLSGFNTTVKQDGPFTTMISVPRHDEAMERWRAMYDKRQKADEAIRKRLCKERKLPFPNGSAVHCDCGKDEAASKFWDERGGHKEDCRFTRPNFLHKPTGFRINWYKYPFRDSYASRKFTPREFAAMLQVDN